MMLRYLLEQISEGKQFTVDIVTRLGSVLPRAEVVEADSVGLLTLQQGCHRLIPWGSIDHVVINEGKCDDDTTGN